MTRDEAALAVIAKVLVNEGGVADIGDGKGVTRFGQTTAWLAQFGLPTPTNAVEAAQNYQVWLVRTRLIGVCDYPDSFAFAIVDWAVNSSHDRVIRELQFLLRTKVDGIYGPETQTKVEACNREAMARFLIGARMRFVGRLIKGNPGEHARWASIWANRIASQVEALT